MLHLWEKRAQLNVIQLAVVLSVPFVNKKREQLPSVHDFMKKPYPVIDEVVI